MARVDGQVVLAPFVIPGERISITTEPVKTGLLRTSSLHVIQPASSRILPRCEYFMDCGGCHYQHIEYAFEREQKRAILVETFQRLGGFAYEGEIHILSGHEWNYRNRVQLHFEDERSGFHKARSRELCAITHCEISSPMLNDVVRALSAAVKQPEWPRFLQSLDIFTNETEVQLTITDSTRPVAARFFEWCNTFLPPLVPGALTYSAAGHSFRVSRGSFFQVNRFLIDALIEEVVGNASGSHAIDLYAGVGLFSLPLAERFVRVEAIEQSGPAARDLEWNASPINNIRAVRAAADKFLQQLDRPPDLIVADPPRMGLGCLTTGELLRLKPRFLKLVSCDPSTLARDLRSLLSEYRLDRLTLIDLFPQTYHFEVVVHLERKHR